jgi:pimeloyl-ACP methyl ester carboxylesterase
MSVLVAALAPAFVGACSTSEPSPGAAPMTTTADVNGTTLAYERRGSGTPLLLVHGAGEDRAALAAQAEDLAAAGYEVITYDRRGTGDSGREDWPGGGARQHADDAAALIDALDIAPATVVGLSSGAVIALDLTARHPEAVGVAVVWEPPAAGVVPGGAEITAGIMAPIDAHLAQHPGDFVGAQAMLLSVLTGSDVAVDDPAFAAAREHAEAMVLDDPTITLATFEERDLRDRPITLAAGMQPNDLIAAAITELERMTGEDAVRVVAEHEVYLFDPSVLTAIVGAAVSASP